MLEVESDEMSTHMDSLRPHLPVSSNHQNSALLLLRLIRTYRCQEILHYPDLVTVLGILVGDLLSVRMYAQVLHGASNAEAKLFGIAALRFDPPQLRLFSALRYKD